jgi:hypothetical protein
VNPALAALAAVTIAGAILAVSARDVRATLLGLLVVLLGAPLVANPWPDPLSILVRIAATLLAVRLMAIGLRGDATTGGTRIGWPAEALIAAAAAVIGFGSHGLGAAGLGPPEAQAVGFALIALAAAPLFAGRDAVRLSTGALLLLLAAASIRTALDPSPSPGEQLVEAILTISIGGAIAVITSAARAAGGLEAIDVVGRGELVRRLPDAHRAVGPAPDAVPPPASPHAPRAPSGPSRPPSAGPRSAPPGRAPRRPAPRRPDPRREDEP